MDAVILIAVGGAIFFSALPIYLYIDKLKARNRALVARNILLTLGEHERLSYRKIIELLNDYREMKFPESKSEAELVSMIVPRVVADIKVMTRYEQLRLYLQGCPKSDDNPLMSVIHKQMSILCNGKIAELMGYEIERTKGIRDLNRRLIELNDIISDLDSESLRYFYFQKSNKALVGKLKLEIETLRKIELPKVVPFETVIETKVIHKEQT